METTPMNWYLAAPFIQRKSDQWLTRYVPNHDESLKFHSVPAGYTHDRSRKITGFDAWRDYMRHGNAVWRAAGGDTGPRGVITCFPQLPITVGLRKRVAFSNIPLVAWTFNLGKLYPGLRRRLARLALPAVDRFIVHSRHEIEAYSDWLNLPPERFQFVPLQRATRPITFNENKDKPFLLSMGSAQRDYRLLFGVLAELGYPAVIVAGPHAVAGLSIPPNVEVRSGLSSEQCFELVQRARISVIPIANQHTASGQVTLLDAMVFGRPVVITACPASTDYVTDRHDALLVRHGNHDDMKEAISRLWEDSTLRTAISTSARETAINNFSDEAVGKIMGSVLRDVSASYHIS
ncbi:MAG: glycosyltransferase [Herminiimonas sp.]|nr:glycosyltransferase [Herminiimonas sp.]